MSKIKIDTIFNLFKLLVNKVNEKLEKDIFIDQLKLYNSIREFHKDLFADSLSGDRESDMDKQISVPTLNKYFKIMGKLGLLELKNDEKSINIYINPCNLVKGLIFFYLVINEKDSEKYDKLRNKIYKLFLNNSKSFSLIDLLVKYKFNLDEIFRRLEESWSILDDIFLISFHIQLALKNNKVNLKGVNDQIYTPFDLINYDLPYKEIVSSLCRRFLGEIKIIDLFRSSEEKINPLKLIKKLMLRPKTKITRFELLRKRAFNKSHTIDIGEYSTTINEFFFILFVFSIKKDRFKIRGKTNWWECLSPFYELYMGSLSVMVAISILLESLLF